MQPVCHLHRCTSVRARARYDNQLVCVHVNIVEITCQHTSTILLFIYSLVETGAGDADGDDATDTVGDGGTVRQRIKELAYARYIWKHVLALHIYCARQHNVQALKRTRHETVYDRRRQAQCD